MLEEKTRLDLIFKQWVTILRLFTCIASKGLQYEPNCWNVCYIKLARHYICFLGWKYNMKYQYGTQADKTQANAILGEP